LRRLHKTAPVEIRNLRFSIFNFQFSIQRAIEPSVRQNRTQFVSPDAPRSTLHAAFTLIEIMIVVGIMGVVLTMGVPIVYKAWHKAPMSKAISDIIEVCSHARAQAIMQGREVDVVFHPKEGRLEVGSAPAPTPAQPSPNTRQAPQRVPVFPSSHTPSAGSGLSAQLSDKILIEMMDINKLPHEFRDDDVARVRFFPNGTCDELTLILVSDQNERREITLETTTSLANVESDPRRFK
jgi:prepilin-type N-terminal cleavage/methylation domain-containing protein